MNNDIINKLDKIMEPYRIMGEIIEPYQRLGKMMEPYKKMMEPYHKIEKMMEPFRNFQNLMEPIREMQAATEFINIFHKQIETSFLAVRRNIEYLNDFHLKSPIFNSPLFEQFEKISKVSDRIKEVIEQTPQALLLLAEYGWYLDYDSDFSLPIDLAMLIRNEQIEELDEYLVDYYNYKLESIIIELQERHSKRTEIFAQISSSFKEKQYFVVIPCVLAQIDGIANDFTNKKFFLKDKNNNYLPQVTAEITKISKFTMESFLSPLTNQTPIIANESKLDSFPVTLNRHTILHGIDFEYGNEKNCLKCISLLKYLSDILIKIDKE